MTCPMPLPLRPLLRNEVHGIYKGHLPNRMRWLAPMAADSFLHHLRESVIVSDMLRSAESSLLAVKQKRGAMRPGYSGHNYGYSIDIDVTRTMKRLKLKSKRELDKWMKERGWYCHRCDHKRVREEWHYNFLAPHPGYGAGRSVWLRKNETRTSAALERMLAATFGKHWKVSRKDLQRLLRSLKYYSGKIDGDLGPLSKQAIMAFQRAWRLKVDAIAGVRTQRTLAFVTAERAIVRPLEA